MNRRGSWFGVILSLFVAARAFANGPEVGWDGGSIVPLESSTIRLLGERVTAWLGSPDYPGGNVNVIYWLHNPSTSPVSFDMTFVMSPGPLEEEASWKHRYGFSVRGEEGEIPVQWRPASPDRWTEYTTARIDSLPVWRLSIPAGDTIKVAFDYRADVSGGGEGNGYRVQFRYLARPAALWAGKLEFAEFRINPGNMAHSVANDDPWVSECPQIDVRPPGWIWDAGSLNWRFEDWEPDQDITIEADCETPVSKSEFLFGARSYGDTRMIPLPEYSGDRKLYFRDSVLSDLREAFLNQRIGARVRPS